MAPGRHHRLLWFFAAAAMTLPPGCAAMRARDADPLLRPCTDGFATTDDGWCLGIRRVRPEVADPGKLPVVLCHGLGLNGTFWTMTDHHLPGQLARDGYEVFIVDLRGSGASRRVGPVGRINRFLRETPMLEIGEGSWTVDDQARHDVPAILDYVRAQTGRDRVNWVGHSLGGMLMYAHLETTDHPERIATFVGMGSTIVLAGAPESSMLNANRGLRVLLRLVSTGRIARPMMYGRPKALAMIDGFYYTPENVDPLTVDRFYRSALEDPGRGALRQLDPYLERGRFLSADGSVDYVAGLPRIRTPTLLIAGEKDIMSDVPSSLITLDRMGSPDKEMQRFGRRDGHADDYGHCDLVWSRYAPVEVFPAVLAWLDRRQPGVSADWPARPSPQGPPDR